MRTVFYEGVGSSSSALPYVVNVPVECNHRRFMCDVTICGFSVCLTLTGAEHADGVMSELKVQLRPRPRHVTLASVPFV